MCMAMENLIKNYGIVSVESGEAIWFQNDVIGKKNVIENYGTISTGGGNTVSVIGASPKASDAGIEFHNHATGIVEGGITFGSAGDEMYWHAGSEVTGHINGLVDGGEGTDTFTLLGEEGTQGELDDKISISNFETLIKDQEGSWTILEDLSGFQSTTVKDGTLAYR